MLISAPLDAVGRTTLQKCLLEGFENIERGLAAHMNIEHVFYDVAVARWATRRHRSLRS